VLTAPTLAALHVVKYVLPSHPHTGGLSSQPEDPSFVAGFQPSDLQLLISGRANATRLGERRGAHALLDTSTPTSAVHHGERR